MFKDVTLSAVKPRFHDAQFKQRVFDRWCPVLDEALKDLPDSEEFENDLIKILAERRSVRRKKICLVTRDGAAVAIAPLRKLNAFAWQPVTQYILPGTIFPTSGQSVFDILEFLNLNIRVALWRASDDVPDDRRVHGRATTATFGMRCSEDFEAYWKSTDIWRHLRSARNKWKHLTLKENAPGCSEWVISNWARKWGVPEDEMEDRIAAARVLEARGKHFSLTLFDGDRPVAGQTCLNHRGDMVGQCIYRAHDQGGIGNRLLHLTFCWAQEKGFRAIDIGGGHDYKRKFAPPGGERYEFSISPRIPYLIERGIKSASWRGRNLLGKVFPVARKPTAGQAVDA